MRDLIKTRVAAKPPQTFSVLIESFGYKHGIPSDADFVFDVRCLPNPHWVPELRNKLGTDTDVANYLSSQPLVNQMYDDIKKFLEIWIPHFKADNRSYITIAIGCTGGQHRSVYLAERIAKNLASSYKNIITRHRELL